MSNLNLIPIGKLFDLEKGSLQSSKCTEGEYTFITAAEEWKTHNEYSHECEALIFAAAASGSLGRTHYINDKFITSDLCFILTPKDSKKYPINLKFYHFVFNSLKDEIVKNTKSGTSKESINQSNLRNYEIPYFEIDKQNLWIDKLVNTKSIKEDLELELSTGQSLLKQLKQTILQEAIEGKLTEKWRAKNPDIGTAKELLEQIKTEKEKLVKDKKIKASKPLPPIKEDEIPFDIPQNWEWCRLGDIIYYTDGGKSPNCENKNIQQNEWGVIKTTAIQEMLFLESENKVLPKNFKILENYVIKNYDLLITRAGPINRVGIVCQVKDLKSQLILSDKTIRINHNKVLLDTSYLEITLNSKAIKQIMQKSMTGMADSQVNISQDNMKNFILPLPPLEEQKEIVATIEKLFTICDELESEINQNKTTVDNLMVTVLKESFEN
ncbi:restriction endonuclease subunit S [Aliarcobacter butzleri]|uniref:Restriction endonuclease subunit S n=1 Tax=Aliarcobacter butzleri TaxID=28197 RepID=A0AAP4UXR2_9BACT|nr:restriction endonuclease subunit S [Aliarcobacter butzleri]MDN5051597.1 restriction endonuclease subunit S [Aliarcobacter butzleri]MDN5074908.1 restriction endonuclease subunit S [Aliarcobacter butzleri]MDN5115748.1 restriction endonuclease subunit S [Aliarcobacter butzleri]MDN5131525.1 restriction endonuclease subunit S [Aliarcobacter butzleri]NUW25766.1 restriction endonuclease subunit S [Aliarcobacter butzleri]